MSDFLPAIPGRFSIVVPSYQQGRYIERTLQSLWAQNDPDLEVIVQDGGSTDETVAILRRYSGRLTWVSGKDGGQTMAINAGLRKSAGEFAAYLNSDDILYPGALARVREVFAGNPAADIIYGQARHIDEQDQVLEEYPVEPWDYRRLLQTCYLCQPATFWRRSVHERVGLFDPTLQFCMDYEFWLRAGQSCSFHHLPQVLAGSRRHPEAKTSRLRRTGHQEICQVVPRYNNDRLPLKWARARAKTEAEATLRSDDPLPWSWLKYATSYWANLIRTLPRLMLEDRRRMFTKLSPPFWSSRKIMLSST